MTELVMLDKQFLSKNSRFLFKGTYLKAAIIAIITLMFITAAVLPAVLSSVNPTKFLPWQILLPVLSLIAFIAAIGFLVLYLNLVRSLKQVLVEFRAIRSDDDFNRELIALGARPGIVKELLAEINDMVDTINSKHNQISDMAQIIKQREHENQLLLLEIEHNLCLAQEEAETDALTGLYNRKVIEERFEVEVEKADQLGYPISVLMADLDHFKKVNDTFGHPIGDEVLKIFAKILKKSVRTSDIAARYGGEEFVIVLPETSADYAIKVAQRINSEFTETVRRELAVLQGHTCTVSVGIADYPTCSEKKYGLISAADLALFKAKQNGRNCVVYYGDVKELQAPLRGA